MMQVTGKICCKIVDLRFFLLTETHTFFLFEDEVRLRALHVSVPKDCPAVLDLAICCKQQIRVLLARLASVLFVP